MAHLKVGDIVTYVGQHPRFYNPEYLGSIGQVLEVAEDEYRVLWWPFFSSPRVRSEAIHYAENIAKMG